MIVFPDSNVETEYEVSDPVDDYADPDRSVYATAPAVDSP